MSDDFLRAWRAAGNWSNATCATPAASFFQKDALLIHQSITAIRSWFGMGQYASLSGTVETTDQQNTDAFFAELAVITNQSGSITHAFADSKEGTIGYVQLHRDGGSVTIHRIWTVFPRRGHGSKMLRKICALADRHNIFIKLKIAPLGRKPYPMSAHELREWYHQHGFQGEKKLVRAPKGESAKCRVQSAK